MYKKTHDERLEVVRRFAGLNKAEIDVLCSAGGIGFTEADLMVENAIGTFALPMGIATNFTINQRDCLIPMVIEEPSSSNKPRIMSFTIRLPPIKSLRNMALARARRMVE